MSDIPPVRVALLGYGYWGPNIARTLIEIPSAELAGCCDDNPLRLREAQERFAVPVADRWQDVLADPSRGAAIVAPPAPPPRELTLACLAHDKHVLVEKPFATSAAEAEEMY